MLAVVLEATPREIPPTWSCLRGWQTVVFARFQFLRNICQGLCPPLDDQCLANLPAGVIYLLISNIGGCFYFPFGVSSSSAAWCHLLSIRCWSQHFPATRPANIPRPSFAIFSGVSPLSLLYWVIFVSLFTIQALFPLSHSLSYIHLILTPPLLLFLFFLHSFSLIFKGVVG